MPHGDLVSDHALNPMWQGIAKRDNFLECIQLR